MSLQLRLYELTFIARQDMTPAQVESLAQGYINTIREQGGDVTKTEFCGLRNLAYPIKKNKKGYYVLLNVKASPETIAEIERQIKINENIIRYLTVRVEELDAKPSPLMQQRSFREEGVRHFDEEDYQAE